jgi:hypothetical protein
MRIIVRFGRKTLEPKSYDETALGMDRPTPFTQAMTRWRLQGCGSNPARVYQSKWHTRSAPRPAAATLWRGPVLRLVKPQNGPRRSAADAGSHQAAPGSVLVRQLPMGVNLTGGGSPRSGDCPGG